MQVHRVDGAAHIRQAHATVSPTLYVNRSVCGHDTPFMRIEMTRSGHRGRSSVYMLNTMTRSG